MWHPCLHICGDELLNFQNTGATFKTKSLSSTCLEKHLLDQFLYPQATKLSNAGWSQCSRICNSKLKVCRQKSHSVLMRRPLVDRFSVLLMNKADVVKTHHVPSTGTQIFAVCLGLMPIHSSILLAQSFGWITHYALTSSVTFRNFSHWKSSLNFSASLACINHRSELSLTYWVSSDGIVSHCVAFCATASSCQQNDWLSKYVVHLTKTSRTWASRLTYCFQVLWNPHVLKSVVAPCVGNLSLSLLSRQHATWT